MNSAMNLKLDLTIGAGSKLTASDLTPLFRVRDHVNYINRMPNNVITELEVFERSLTNGVGEGCVESLCIPCGKSVSLSFDMEAGGRQEGDSFFPNWRERLICPKCKMSNRQRLVATLVMQYMESCETRQDVYLMEQTTPLYKWVTNKYKNHMIVGSEYFGSGYQGGDIVGPLDYQAPLRLNNLLNTARHRFSLLYSMLRMGGIRHEDLAKLSFSDASLDLIISNDVFEHIPNPGKAFAECARVLKVGGLMLTTIPFHYKNDESISRAKIVNGQLEHVLPSLYHGNPVSADGSLVFMDFGWDILKEIQASGFSDVCVEVYASVKYGHLGGGQLVFRLTK